MTIIETLLSNLPDKEYPVRNVLVGRYWTLVSSRFCGLGATVTGEGPHGTNRVQDCGNLHKKSANELAGWMRSENPLEASIGTAAYNSLVEVDEGLASEINAADLLAEKGKGKKVAMVGHFPFAERLRETASHFWIIEKAPAEGDEPEEAAEWLLPQADVIAITGMTLINHSLEKLLELSRSAEIVMILGPSTPLSPVLFDFGATLISGSRVVDEEAAALTIQQGAIFPQVKGVRLLTLSRKETA